MGSSKGIEQQIKIAILKYIQLHPGKGFAWNQYNGGRYSQKLGRFLKHGPYHRKGVSDIIGMWCRRALFIEVKAPGGELSPDQEYFLAQAKRHGAIAFKCSSLAEAVDTLDCYEDQSAFASPLPLIQASDIDP